MAEAPDAREGWVYLILAIILGGAPIILFYREPIAYAHLISEDFAGEYATAVAFGAAGVLFLVDAFRAPARGRKALGAILGLMAIGVAGEEVSWGQRGLGYLFGFSVPDWIRAINQQGEMNIHNLEGVGFSRVYRPGSYLLLGWLVFSAWLYVGRRALALRLSASGIPLVGRWSAPAGATARLAGVLLPAVSRGQVG